MPKDGFDDGLDASFIIDQARGRNRRERSETGMAEHKPPQEDSVRREGRRRKGQDYESLFIADAPLTTRSGKTVYIRKEFHERITRIVQVIARNEISLYSYLDNVLSHHFETYQQEISALYKERNPEIF